ncbi:MAG: serine/threonine-protein kinase [Coleofasciculaceae cyanobacterium]
MNAIISGSGHPIACSSCGQENPSKARFCSRCGDSLPQVYANVSGNLTAGIRLRARYIIRHPIGQGGFSRTYLAEDTGRFGELVTIKELTPANLETYALQKAEELFQREAAILHKLSSPQIPKFWEIFRDGQRLFLVQDYIAGKTYQTLLEERIAIGQTFSETEIIELLQQLLPVLSYLHTCGVIHRDISPDNLICRASDGMPVLIDLGGVTKITLKFVTSETENIGVDSTTRLGKIGYAPDEQLRLGIAAPHSDLYALAVTSLVLLTGKQPQQLINLETMEWNWQQYLNLSPLLTSILDQMLASQPINRFQSAEEVLQHLDVENPKTTQVYSPLPKPLATENNNSGAGNLFNDSIKVPDEIQGWNWGAFFAPGVWCITNHVWIGLVSWADFSIVTTIFTFGMTWPLMAILLGVKGNEWAWKSRRWQSVKEFKRHQRLWAIVGFIIFMIFVILITLIIVGILILGLASFGIVR